MTSTLFYGSYVNSSRYIQLQINDRCAFLKAHLNHIISIFREFLIPFRNFSFVFSWIFYNYIFYSLVIPFLNSCQIIEEDSSFIKCLFIMYEINLRNLKTVVIFIKLLSVTSGQTSGVYGVQVKSRRNYWINIHVF